MSNLPKSDNERRLHVIEIATEMFWRYGYDGVSVGDLVRQTGLNRYTLYQVFGGKKDIFMSVLKHYVEGARVLITEYLERPELDPFDAVQDAIIAKMLDPEIFPAGCLICTAAVDMAAKDSEVAAFMAQSSEIIGRDFAEAYATAMECSATQDQLSPEGFAELASALYFSTGVQARMGRSREDLLSGLNNVISGLKKIHSA